MNERERAKDSLISRLDATYMMEINQSDTELERIAADTSLRSVLLDIITDTAIETELRAISARLYSTQILEQCTNISDVEESLRLCLVHDRALVRKGVLYALEDVGRVDLIERLFQNEKDSRLCAEVDAMRGV